MPAQIILNHWNQGGTISNLKWMRPMFMLWDGHCLVLRVSVYQKQGRFIERLKPCVRTNWFLAISSWGIWSNVCVQRTQKDCYGCWRMKKTGWERAQALERALFRRRDVWRTEWFPFHGITKSGRVRRKGLDKEAWGLSPELPRLYSTVMMTGELHQEKDQQAWSYQTEQTEVTPCTQFNITNIPSSLLATFTEHTHTHKKIIQFLSL